MSDDPIGCLAFVFILIMFVAASYLVLPTNDDGYVVRAVCVEADTIPSN